MSVQNVTWNRVASAAILCCFGCRLHERPRARLELEELGVVLDKRAIPIKLSWRTPDGNVLPVVDPWQIRVNPQGLAEVHGSATLRCKRNGEGWVEVNVGSETARARLKCFLGYRLAQARPQPYRLRLGAPPEPTGFFATGSGGVVYKEIPVTVTSNAPEVLAVDGDKLVAKKIGRSRLTATAPGPLETSVEFEVFRFVAQWHIGTRAPIATELTPGQYELSLDCSRAKPLRVVWQDAPRCNYFATSTNHKVTCRLAAPSRLVISPPGSETEEPPLETIELIELEP